MNEVELRKYCLDKSIEILSWHKEFFPRKNLNPVELADILYIYLTTGEKRKFDLPGARG